MQAVPYAVAIYQAAEENGFEIRAGVHSGEVALRQVGGWAHRKEGVEYALSHNATSSKLGTGFGTGLSERSWTQKD
jgi:hypothetical protein